MQGTVTDESSRIAGSEPAAIGEALAGRIGQQKYRVWFKNATRFTLAGGYLKIGVPNLFIANWIEGHFLADIGEAARSVIGDCPKITFAIDPELVGSGRRSRLDSEARVVAGAQRGPRAAGKQTGSRGGRELRMTLETFVVGPSNELAYNAARAVVRAEHSPFNPLFIHGGYGVGKTHLLQGICNAVRRSRGPIKWMYLSAEDFANQFVLALKTKKLESFRRRIRTTDLLAIDDVHFLASKPATQGEFLHTFNTIHLAGKQVVLVSDAHPKMIGQLCEKLVNRFVSGMVVKIEPPDFQTRCRICRAYADRMMGGGLEAASAEREAGSGNRDTRYASRDTLHEIRSTQQRISDGVIRYIAEKLRTNVRELEGALVKLVAFSSLQGEKITLSMAKAVLAEHLERCDPIVHVSDIETVVATYFGVTPAAIHSAKKDRTVTLARHFSMYLIRKHTMMSSSEVGRFMGNKNHATVLMGCRRVEDLIGRNGQIRWIGPNGNKVAKARTILAHLEESISG